MTSIESEQARRVVTREAAATGGPPLVDPQRSAGATALSQAALDALRVRIAGRIA